jgi:hypothetical protein
MRKFISAGIILSILSLSYSCNRSETKIGISKKGEDKITQGSDGTISLNLEEASRYSDKIDPASNTAEWDFTVIKPGRYDVWVSSITKDTMNLQYTSSVKVNLLDARLEAKPIGNRIVADAKDVEYPYYRADSYMGTFYFEEPGEYSIQLISDKVAPPDENINSSNSSDHTKLKSLILTPIIR